MGIVIVCAITVTVVQEKPVNGPSVQMRPPLCNPRAEMNVRHVFQDTARVDNFHAAPAQAAAKVVASSHWKYAQRRETTVDCASQAITGLGLSNLYRAINQSRCPSYTSIPAANHKQTSAFQAMNICLNCNDLI